MGIISSVVIPLVTQQLKQQNERELIARRGEEERKLEELKHSNALELQEAKHADVTSEQIQASTLSKTESKVTSDLKQSNWEKQYYKDLIRSTIVGTAGGIAAGAAKGYFSQRFRNDSNNKASKDKHDKDFHDKFPPTAGGMVSTPYGDVSEPEARKIWDEFHNEWVKVPANYTDEQVKEFKVRRFIENGSYDRMSPQSIVAPGISTVVLPTLTAL